MKICITEKPSVARDIAAILGATQRKDGYFEGAGWCVTWTFGHLCCLKEPHDYTPLWQRWSLGALPMVPARFGIKLIDDEGIRRQFGVIKQLVERADAEGIVNCGDAGQEGELIQRWVMQLAGVRQPVERLWISSLTDDAIRQGFASLKPQADFDRLYHAGLSRAIGDWLLGMNATRLYTLKYAGGGDRRVLSVGRVQTPTLALVVARHEEIANFKPADFWELATIYRGALFSSTGGRITSEEKGREAMEAIKGQPLTITDVKEKKGREAPPKLFDLTSLQVETNRLWGWSADTTLKLIQSLYEKKVTTYPRVDTTYLTDDLYPRIPEIMHRMTPYAPQWEPLLQGGKKLPKTKKVFDNAKVTDHHAIIPTGESPKVLVGDERQLYHLIAMRFIAAFWPDCEFSQTTVNASVGADHKFKATGRTILSPGWRTVLKPEERRENEEGSDKNVDDDSEERVLPVFTVGESGPHEPRLRKKTTQPPKPYTEGTLLRAMETAGRAIADDDALREAMKENGIGRPSTRAAIIETLFKRGYISRKRKSIVPTQAGIDLIHIIGQELLKSARLTGIWEQKLRQIERGDYDASRFIEELKAMVNETVLAVLADNSARRIGDEPAPSKTAKPKKSAKNQ